MEEPEKSGAGVASDSQTRRHHPSRRSRVTLNERAANVTGRREGACSPVSPRRRLTQEVSNIRGALPSGEIVEIDSRNSSGLRDQDVRGVKVSVRRNEDSRFTSQFPDDLTINLIQDC